MLDNIDLFNGINVNNIPFEVGEQMTTTKMLYNMQTKINQVVDAVNSWESDAKGYTDSKIEYIKKQIDYILNVLKTGECLNDGAIKEKHINKSFLSWVDEYIKKSVTRAVGQSMSTINFGLDSKGYFICEIPDNWKDVTFSTNETGNLILDFNL